MRGLIPTAFPHVDAGRLTLRKAFRAYHEADYVIRRLRGAVTQQESLARSAGVMP